MAKPQDNFRYVDRPEVQETFVDSMNAISFGNGLMKLELCVRRFDDPKPPSPPSGRKYTACRLVLTAELVDELMNKLINMNQAMQQARSKETPKGPVN